MGSTRKSPNRTRLVFDPSGINWDDDASIERWTRQVWQYTTQRWGNGMASAPTVRLTSRYTEAVAFASELHASQARKGTSIPYIAHLLGASSLVLEAGGDEDEAIAGLLHDAVEDGGGLPTLEIIRARFGGRVAEIVLLCSDSVDEEWKRNTPYWVRKQAYLDHLEESADTRAVLVSIADKVHNARAIVTDLQRHGASVLKKFNGDSGEILTYYVECLRIAADKQISETLLWPLHKAVVEIDQYVMRVHAA